MVEDFFPIQYPASMIQYENHQDKTENKDSLELI